MSLARATPPEDKVAELVRCAGPALKACLLHGTSFASTKPISIDSLEHEVSAITYNRMSAVALDYIQHHDLQISESTLRAYRTGAIQSAVTCLETESNSYSAIYALTELNIPFVVIKGPAIARFHPNPASRPFTDIDLLIPPEFFGKAKSALNDVGYYRKDSAQQPWEWFERICIESVNLRTSRGGRIDLHHHLPPWILGSLFPASEIIARADEGQIGKLAVKFASLEDSLVISSLHIINDLGKHDLSVVSWRDTLCISDLLGMERVKDIFQKAQLSWYQPYIDQTHNALMDQVAQSPNYYPRRIRQQYRLRQLGWQGSTFASRHPIGWIFRLPISRALCFLIGSLFPSPLYAQHKHDGYFRYWMYTMRSIVQARRGSRFGHSDNSGLN